MHAFVGAFTKADGGLAEEVYILDFEGDLYGKEITLEVFEKIREIQQFSNDAELKKQIQRYRLCSRASSSIRESW